MAGSFGPVPCPPLQLDEARCGLCAQVFADLAIDADLYCAHPARPDDNCRARIHCGNQLEPLGRPQRDPGAGDGVAGLAEPTRNGADCVANRAGYGSGRDMRDQLRDRARTKSGRPQGRGSSEEVFPVERSLDVSVSVDINLGISTTGMGVGLCEDATVRTRSSVLTCRC
jgi:hypothetical protein